MSRACPPVPRRSQNGAFDLRRPWRHWPAYRTTVAQTCRCGVLLLLRSGRPGGSSADETTAVGAVPQPSSRSHLPRLGARLTTVLRPRGVSRFRRGASPHRSCNRAGPPGIYRCSTKPPIFEDSGCRPDDAQTGTVYRETRENLARTNSSRLVILRYWKDERAERCADLHGCTSGPSYEAQSVAVHSFG